MIKRETAKHDRHDWICEYINKNGSQSVKSESFVEEYTKRFNPKRPEYELQTYLAELYRKGFLKRRRVIATNSWYYEYEIR